MDDNEDERASSHTGARMTTRIEIVGRVSGRRRWTVAQKLAIQLSYPPLPAKLYSPFGSGRA
jgi:hypothetical protein